MILGLPVDPWWISGRPGVANATPFHLNIDPPILSFLERRGNKNGRGKDKNKMEDRE